jgi:hypothetical protein
MGTQDDSKPAEGIKDLAEEAQEVMDVLTGRDAVQYEGKPQKLKRKHQRGTEGETKRESVPEQTDNDEHREDSKRKREGPSDTWNKGVGDF